MEGETKERKVIKIAFGRGREYDQAKPMASHGRGQMAQNLRARTNQRPLELLPNNTPENIDELRLSVMIDAQWGVVDRPFGPVQIPNLSAPRSRNGLNRIGPAHLTNQSLKLRPRFPKSTRRRQNLQFAKKERKKQHSQSPQPPKP